jgi:hypothetical protein
MKKPQSERLVFDLRSELWTHWIWSSSSSHSTTMFSAICLKGNIKYYNCTVFNVMTRLHRFSFSTFLSSINLNIISLKLPDGYQLQNFIFWAIMLCNPLKKSSNISQEHITAISRVKKQVKQETSRKQVASKISHWFLAWLIVKPRRLRLQGLQGLL